MNVRNVDGKAFELYDSGKSGDPVLLVHSTRDDWYRVVTETSLPDNFRVILPHRRGFGRSTSEGFPNSFVEHAADYRMVLQHLGIEKAHVAGLSVGGSITLQMAKDWPEGVHSLVLLEPALMSVIANHEQVGEALGEAASRYQEGDKEGAITIQFEELCGPDAWSVLPQESFERLMEDADTLYHGDGAKVAEWVYTSDDSARIDQPVLNVTGANTRPYYTEVHETIKSWIPHAENVVIEDTKHPILQTQPKKVAEAMADFFSSHRIHPELHPAE
jgi:pimeloyl-ACP methyl ester carboxylesterase